MTPNAREAAIDAIAERLDDPLTMLGVDPDGRDKGDDLSGHSDHQETVKRTLARAALEALETEQRRELREYLDDAIRKWRGARDARGVSRADRHTAECYVDAFQSVRASILGELLPVEAIQ